MSEPSKRPRIVLPSFKEVQAAQRASKNAPNLFQSRQAASNAGGPSAAPSSHPTESRQPAPTPSNRPAPQSNAAMPSQPQGSAPTGIQIPNTSSYRPQAAENVLSQRPPELQVRPPASHAGPSRDFGPSNPSFQPPAAPMVCPVVPTIPGSSFRTRDLPSCMQQIDYSAFNASPNAILVSKRQEGNPLLKHIRNVRWVYADIVPDYIMGADICALFLSMRFHLLKPDYIHHRIKELQRSFRLRVLMCYVDIDDVIEPLQQITRAAILNGVTLICGWSSEECARYLETYKAYETKSADSIKGHTDEDYLSRLNAALTTIRGVNRTDVLTLGGTFKTAASIMQAPMKDLAGCPGIGPTKVQRIYDTFHEPFRKSLKLKAPQAAKPKFVTATGSQALNTGSQHNVLDALDVVSDIQDSSDDGSFL